ncbi:MAG: class I SAM-dependent methyltransferase [Thermoleophilaceae bacterium]
MNYRLAYAIGFHPWEDLSEHPPFANTLLGLVVREEDGRDPPYGPALDLGTGSAVWGVQLARRGWRVTGVDIVDKAMRRARERVDAAGVDVRLVHGDVTALGRATAVTSSRGPRPSKSEGLRVSSGSSAASAVAAISRSMARRPRALRPAPATCAYTRP